MTLHYLKLLRAVKRITLLRPGTAAYCNSPQILNKKEFRTENNIKFLEDPDTFGNLSGHSSKQIIEDEGDIKEEEYLQKKPMNHQKLTIRQYADLIKQYIKYKRLKEAIDVLEVRMLKEDRVKPENYIYNILIGACADVGYTKKAFKLYNDMKRRSLPPTGDTYTCLFEACANSPWTENGLKNAKNLRNLMLEKGIEPNLTNYNAMIKAFGRCGDLVSAFKCIDEMRAKKIKIRIHTFNHLLHACISDKESGLRHALIVWRKMLKVREKPNIYSFNLMLRCVKECNLGSYEDMIELINNVQEHIAIQDKTHSKQIQSELMTISENTIENANLKPEPRITEEKTDQIKRDSEFENEFISNTQLSVPDNNVKIELVDKIPKVLNEKLPNLLSRNIEMDKVLDLKPVSTPQEKFAIVGGLRGFLEEMAVLSVKPDIKTFTQMLPLLSNTEEETKLIDFMKNANVRRDINFYNMLIKSRSMRMDYEAAFQVMTLIKEEQQDRKKIYFLNKKRKFNIDIMTYGALALACKTMECAEKLLSDMKEAKLKVNIQILGTLLRHGTSNSDFKYVLFIMDTVKEENIQVNDIFLKHLENFNSKCMNIIKQNKNGQRILASNFINSFKSFSKKYVQWLNSMNLDDALQTEDPWKQFKESYPETVQRQDIDIKEPKKFYKRSRKYHKYIPHK